MWCDAGTRCLMITLALIALAPRPAGAGCEIAKLTASDGTSDDQLGASVAVDGDAIIAGALGDDENGPFAGAAFVFRHDGASWVEEARLLPDDGGEYHNFGNAVAISGDAVLVGARGADDVGAAYVFRHDGAVWTQEAKLVADDGEPFGWFGASVALGSDVAIVGAESARGRGPETGAAYVFRCVDGMWTQEAKLVIADGEAGDRFGASVSLAGDAAVIGADFDDDVSINEGAAYVYRHDGETWVEEAALRASDGAENDLFGASVAMGADVVAVGAVGVDDQRGAVYVFRRGGGVWEEEAKVTASDGDRLDDLGAAVAIAVDVLVAGAPFADGANGNAGAVYVFRRDEGGWLEDDKLAAECDTNCNLGRSLGMTDGAIVAGAPGDDERTENAGAAHVLTPGACPCPADVDGDGLVGFEDLVAVLAAWGNEGGPEDVDGSGVVDFEDVIALLAAWGPCA